MNCVPLHQHERSLVQRYRNRPFTLLGVNSDPDREVALAKCNKQGLHWQSWWDGPEGPIAKEWQVEGWPSIFLIDAEGVVRHANLDPRNLERAIETLVREQESRSATARAD